MRTPSPAQGKRTWWCLNDSQLACYADGILSGWRRRWAERHLVGCEHCRSELSFLLHSERLPSQSPSPAWIARVRQLGQNQESTASGWWRWAVAGPVLACGLAVGAWFIVHPHSAPVTVAKRAAPVTLATTVPEADTATEVRSLTKATVEPVLIAPTTGATVARDFEVKWQPVPDALRYDVTILNPDGDMVWHASTSALLFRMPPTAPLRNGAEYFVTVSVNLSSGKTVRARAVPFRVDGK